MGSEQSVEMPVSQIQEKVGEQGRISDHVVEQVVDTSGRQIREQSVEVVKVIHQERLQWKMTSLGDMRADEEVDEMMRETNGDGDVRQCTVEQTDGMPVRAELHSSRHRDVPRHGRGEDALVPWIWEHFQAATGEAEIYVRPSDPFSFDSQWRHGLICCFFSTARARCGWKPR